MGGWNSGNRSHRHAKATTDGCRTLDVRLCARAGVLKPGSCSSCRWTRRDGVAVSIQIRAERGRLMLNVNFGEVGKHWSTAPYIVGIATTPCHLGGSRAWFICPTRHCGRRVAVLYVGAILACRHCLRLAYVSTREDVGDRAMRRAEKLRARLGWRPGIANAKGGKPKWMHWGTYDRLWCAHQALVGLPWRAMAQKAASYER